MQNTSWTVTFPTRVFAGKNSIQRLKDLEIKPHMRIALLTDQDLYVHKTVEPALEVLSAIGTDVHLLFCPGGEPDSRQVISMLESIRSANPQWVIAVGGGSVMDMAKLQAVLMTNPGLALNLRDTSRISARGLPTVMIPTTVGTGSEATMNSVILFREEEMKCGILHEYLLPHCVILDPVFTATLPPSIVASTGMDALCHAMESYISRKATPMSRLWSLDASKRIAASIEKACQRDEEALMEMQLAAFEAGLCLNSSCTVAVHALSYPVGGKYHVPHGIANAILLPYVMQENAPWCRKELAELADAMMPENPWRTDEESANGLIEMLFEMCERLQIPANYTSFGMNRDDIPYLAENALKVRRLLDFNPRPLALEDIVRIFEKTLI